MDKKVVKAHKIKNLKTGVERVVYALIPAANIHFYF